MQRHVFFISDGTGITAESLGLSLISQFDAFEFTLITLPYVDTPDKAEAALEQISETYQTQGHKPIVFATLVAPHLRSIVAQAPALVIDLFNSFIPQLESELGAEANWKVGRSHGVSDREQYHHRIEAINFTLNTDDGLNPSYYDDADIILVGVSRSGKTPTSIYLALHYGLATANYPLTEDDLRRDILPRPLTHHAKKCFGLTIDPEHLNKIRTERLNDSQYASLKQCKKEIECAEGLFAENRIPMLNTTHLSVEEIATKIVAEKKLERKLI